MQVCVCVCVCFCVRVWLCFHGILIICGTWLIRTRAERVRRLRQAAGKYAENSTRKLKCTILNDCGADFLRISTVARFQLPHAGYTRCVRVCVCVCDTAHPYVLWCIDTCDMTHSSRILHPWNDLYVCIHYPCRVWEYMYGIMGYNT